jgi:hypothetical protein
VTRIETIARALLGITLVGIVLYWAVIFAGVVRIEPLLPGYVDWYMAFPLADLWIAAAAPTSLACWRRNERMARVFLAATGSALIFLGLNALLYGYRTGLLFTLTPEEIVEIIIKAYCLGAGSLLVAAAGRGDAAGTMRRLSSGRHR